MKNPLVKDILKRARLYRQRRARSAGTQTFRNADRALRSALEFLADHVEGLEAPQTDADGITILTRDHVLVLERTEESGMLEGSDG